MQAESSADLFPGLTEQEEIKATEQEPSREKKKNPRKDAKEKKRILDKEPVKILCQLAEPGISLIAFSDTQGEGD